VNRSSASRPPLPPSLRLRQTESYRRLRRVVVEPVVHVRAIVHLEDQRVPAGIHRPRVGAAPGDPRMGCPRERRTNRRPAR
jgi:hypothetical protein